MDKTNNDLQIYTNSFPPHSINVISTFDSTLEGICKHGNCHPYHLPPSQKGKVVDVLISFTLLDAPYCREPTPLFIPAQLNGQTITGVMVGLSSRFDVITEETLFVNGWNRLVYDECHTTLWTHHGFSINPLGNITLMVMVHPKAVYSIFTIILESDLF